MILMTLSSFQIQRFVFCCHSQHAELWTPCDLNSCLDMPLIGGKRSPDSSRYSTEHIPNWSVTMMLLMMFSSFQMQRFVFWCYSWCSRHSKCSVLSFAVIPSMLSYERLATWTRVWTCQSLWSGSEEQVTQRRCYRHPTWAITRNAIWASMVGLAHHGSCSLIGGKRSPDSSRCSTEHIPDW